MKTSRTTRLGRAVLLGLLLLLARREAPAEEARKGPPRAGPEATAAVIAELGAVDMPALQQYLSDIGQRLARQVPPQAGGFRFFVVDQWMPNAFALPDGSIFVSRGLVALAGSEAELANVLSHEIVHVIQRHAIGRQAVAESANPFLLGFLRAGYLAGFSRDQERDADQLGQSIAAGAGYDPRAMSVFLRKLEYAERLQLGASRIPGFFDTHPSSAERAATAYERGEKMPFRETPPLARNTEEYVHRLEGLAMDDDPSQGIFRDTRFLHPDLGFTIFFPDGWTPVNTPDAVGAFSPQRDARIALELAGPGTDPEAAARDYLKKHEDEVKFLIERQGPVTISGRPAFEAAGRVLTPAGGVAAVLTFVTLGDRVYLISTVAKTTVASSYRGRAAATVRSLRPLEPEERESIRVLRLRSAKAEAGETLEELSRRTRNALDLQRTAVANGLFTEDRLHEGQVLKVAVSEPYRSPETPKAPAPVATPPDEP